jgi:hypothetical protein
VRGVPGARLNGRGWLPLIILISFRTGDSPERNLLSPLHSLLNHSKGRGLTDCRPTGTARSGLISQGSERRSVSSSDVLPELRAGVLTYLIQSTHSCTA